MMITNHAHARTHEPPLPRGTKIQKEKGFIAPIFASAEISKTIKMFSKYGTTNVIIRKKWNGTNMEQNGTFKIPHLEIWCCYIHITQLPPSRLKFDTKLRKVFPNNLAP